MVEASTALDLCVSAGTLKSGEEEEEAVDKECVFKEDKPTIVKAKVAVNLSALERVPVSMDEEPLVPSSPASPFTYFCSFLGATTGILGLVGGTTNANSSNNAVSSPATEELEKKNF
jgi:hypothetical protein